MTDTITTPLTTEHIAKAREVLKWASARGEDVSLLWESLSIASESLARTAHEELRAMPQRHAVDRPKPFRPAEQPEVPADVPTVSTEPHGEPSIKRKWFPWSD